MSNVKSGNPDLSTFGGVALTKIGRRKHPDLREAMAMTSPPIPAARQGPASAHTELACHAPASAISNGTADRRAHYSALRRAPRRVDKGRNQAHVKGARKRATKGAMQGALQGAEVAAAANALLEGLKLDACEGAAGVVL